tara:strand:- start:188 stop:361 length:174 start_codon:yes stop_codon:yes gene_type:complete
VRGDGGLGPGALLRLGRPVFLLLVEVEDLSVLLGLAQAQDREDTDDNRTTDSSVHHD